MANKMLLRLCCILSFSIAIPAAKAGEPILSRIAFGSCARQDKPQPLWTGSWQQPPAQPPVIETPAPPTEAVQKLIANFGSPDEAVRLVAAKELGKLGPSARAAIPALQRALQDADEDVRRVAANSIRLIQAAATPNRAVQDLIQKLQSPDEGVRLKAAKELGKIGPPARDAIPALQKLLQDADEDFRSVAAIAIERIQGSRATPPPVQSIAGTTWNGTEAISRSGKLTFQFDADGKAIMIDSQSRTNGKWVQNRQSRRHHHAKLHLRGDDRG